MSSLRCRIGWHDWTRFGSPKESYGQLVQFRECKRCGLVDSKKNYHEQAKPEKIRESLEEGKVEANNDKL